MNPDRQPIVDQRTARRRRTLKQGRIVFQDGHCVLYCCILDLSDTGAKLRTSDILLCPSNFVLKREPEAPRECEVVWRSGEVMGVRFL